jgi:hypothetical protein
MRNGPAKSVWKVDFCEEGLIAADDDRVAVDVEEETELVGRGVVEQKVFDRQVAVDTVTRAKVDHSLGVPAEQRLHPGLFK